MQKHLSKLALFLGIIFIMSGCWSVGKSPEPIKTETVELFFASSDGKELKSQGRQLEKGNTDSLARQAVDALLKGPQDKDLKALIPDGTKMNVLSIKDGLATVDFSPEFGNASNGELLKIYSVVKTLCVINGIDKVIITVAGKLLELSSGEDMGELTPDMLKNMTSVTREVEAKLYFLDTKLNLVSEKRKITIQPDADTEEVALRELIKGPAVQGHIKTVPQGTKLISLFVKDGICNINLSAEFEKNRAGSDMSDRAAVDSIVKTLTEFDNIKSVRFYIDGKSVDNYGSVETKLPLGR